MLYTLVCSTNLFVCKNIYSFLSFNQITKVKVESEEGNSRRCKSCFPQIFGLDVFNLSRRKTSLDYSFSDNCALLLQLHCCFVPETLMVWTKSPFVSQLTLNRPKVVEIRYILAKLVLREDKALVSQLCISLLGL